MSEREVLADGPISNAKCRRPGKGNVGRWCAVLGAVLSDDSNRGIFVYDALIFKTGKFKILGVAAREGCKRTGRPILFNRCPFCGEPIFWPNKKPRTT